jgi:hypothetical protein
MVAVAQCILGHASGRQARLRRAFLNMIDNYYILGHEELTVHPL